MRAQAMVAARALSVDLVAVVVAVTDDVPRVLTTEDGAALPAGPFEQGHRSLQAGLRAWVEARTHHPIGYVEQLYTFADRDRVDAGGEASQVISISYLALTREAAPPHAGHADWQDWYRYFPWEDWRQGTPAIIDTQIRPHLRRWVATAPAAQREARGQRIESTFGWDDSHWNEDFVLQRYELLFETGLVAEASRDDGQTVCSELLGRAMRHDYRRILATGLARLRAKIKYRPVVFELMPPAFTLLQLQQTVEALAGRCLHKQNFRRLVEQQELVEETGRLQVGGTGRPAKLFRFRRGVMLERAIAGSKLPLARTI